MNKVYEKPKMKFSSLQNENNVAEASCWSDVANNKQDDGIWVYDGTNNRKDGYVVFQIDSSCKGTYKYEAFYTTENYLDENGNLLKDKGISLSDAKDSKDVIKYLEEQAKPCTGNPDPCFKHNFTKVDGVGSR